MSRDEFWTGPVSFWTMTGAGFVCAALAGFFAAQGKWPLALYFAFAAIVYLCWVKYRRVDDSRRAFEDGRRYTVDEVARMRRVLWESRPQVSYTYAPGESEESA
ncbi:conserved hypothetical protein [Segniliparus rotundus DSM 44985]|uniref:Uncharacterized protein n=1 Tax=Segniliparus rotundus (strain ATCC BAA-972 / CDC 1076 / CIP 108378 / DSM 44985 / JCM 13578) TaxID=640132 RepID=D6Z9L6_SEGRD|nr:hypothetical protein [Segniliparus rotundus]ADG96543.1 conserved hypothetical protein [Segniliparus rotundus DSM 44985]